MECGASKITLPPGWVEQWDAQKAELAEVRREVEWQEKEHAALLAISGPSRKTRKRAKRIGQHRKALEGFERAVAQFEMKIANL